MTQHPRYAAHFPSNSMRHGSTAPVLEPCRSAPPCHLPAEGDAFEWHAEAVSHIVGEVDENGVKEPSGPDLHGDAVVGAGPEVAKAEAAFDEQAGRLDIPAATGEVDHVWEGERGGIADGGEVAGPTTLVRRASISSLVGPGVPRRRTGSRSLLGGRDAPGRQRAHPFVLAHSAHT
jgi:hypothetical protein